MSDFVFKTEQFEGPLDLLLLLIEKRKLHINDIALAQVTEEYIKHINQGGSISVDKLADFISVASTLILIKSYSLIQTLAVSQEESASMEELARRLKLYQRIKELSLYVREMYGKRVIHGREIRRVLEPIFTPTAEITPPALLSAMKGTISTLPQPIVKPPETIISKVISLEEVIEDLIGRVQKAFKLKFSEFVADKKERVNVIVSFLGLLELVKQGLIEVRQDNLFQEIDLESRSVGVPHY